MSRFPFLDEPEERDLTEVVNRATRKPLVKRFYKQAVAEPEGDSFVLKLDGRTARTPARNVLQVQRSSVASALAEEWNQQGDEIVPSAMPLSRIVNSALDAVADHQQEVIGDLLRYVATDLVFYRSEGPERLQRLQATAWDPVILWCHNSLKADFKLATGVVHVEQPKGALNVIERLLSEIPSPIALAALHVMTTLCGSVLIPLAHIHGLMTKDEAWQAAHVDELYQESIWGKDEEALIRRETREKEFQAASQLFFLETA